jgi:hypothetical protein
MCLLEFWNCLDYGLTIVLQSNTQVQIYHYVEKDSQPKQAPMCYVMMLSQLVANIDYIWLSLFPIEWHYLVKGAKFGQDWADWFDHFQMVILGYFTSWYKSKRFRPQIKIIFKELI